AAAPAIVWRRFTSAHPPAIPVADIDGDGSADLFIAGAIEAGGRSQNAVLLNRGTAGFELAAALPLAAVPGVTAAAWGDYDNDGLVGVYFCRGGADQLVRPTAKGQWAGVTAGPRPRAGRG